MEAKEREEPMKITFATDNASFPELDAARIKLAEINAKIAKLQRITGRNNNPAGDIGGIRSWSRKRKERNMDSHINACTKLVPLYQGQKLWAATVERLEKHGPTPPPKTAPTREQIAAAAFEMFNHYKPGDKIDVGGNSPITVAKKNRASVID